eukprot:2278465-Rhodomonas_salina.1
MSASPTKRDGTQCETPSSSAIAGQVRLLHGKFGHSGAMAAVCLPDAHELTRTVSGGCSGNPHEESVELWNSEFRTLKEGRLADVSTTTNHAVQGSLQLERLKVRESQP